MTSFRGDDSKVWICDVNRQRYKMKSSVWYCYKVLVGESNKGSHKKQSWGYNSLQSQREVHKTKINDNMPCQ